MPLGDRRPGVMLPGGLGMDSARRLAAESEAAGAEAVWIADVRREPYLLSAAALMDTTKIEVGTNVAVAFPRSPALTAQAAWDLNGWSRGRFVLGLGSQVKGTLENRFGVSAEHPGPMLRDYVHAVRACFSSYREGHGRYEGPHYRIRQPVFMPGADDWPEPAVYVAGVNPVMTEIAGECADGFAAHMYSTEAYLDEVIRPALARGAASAGRSEPVVLLSIVVAPDRETLARQMTTYTVPGYRRVLDHSGLAEEGSAILAALAERRRADAQRLIDEKVLDLLAVVTLEDLPAGIRRWAPHADRLALSVPWFGIPDAQQVEIFRGVLAALERL
ncbi:MAG TPA: LLM class flavin-dependent oxidoreductase [Candidatus Dormibacteraeota bacterium]|nr:LLM class flavin-dependent oxidoreductase [Candidatus Dormibacteraeota bacterium]